MTKTELLEHLHALKACPPAIAWVKAHASDDAQDIWQACERGDWMLWLAGKHSGEPEGEGRKRLVLAACECARLALPIWEKRFPQDKRVRVCIETAERWARGEATMDELKSARRDAYAASADAAAFAAAAASAASAASASYASDASASAYAASADAARMRVLKQCADIVRKHYPIPPTS